MSARKVPRLKSIENNEPITRETHYDFFCHLQSALLLALREQGRLNAMQHRHAEENLKQLRRDRARSILEKGENT